MLFTYQDSTKLPVQRDFIHDIQEFVNVCKAVIPLENSKIKLDEDAEKAVKEHNMKLNEISELEQYLINYVEHLDNVNEFNEISSIKNNIISASKKIVSEEVEQIQQHINKIQDETNNEINAIDSKILNILTPFFSDYIYYPEKTYSAYIDNSVLVGELTASIKNISYKLKLRFIHEILKVNELHDKIALPTWKATGIIHKENKVKLFDVSNFILYSANIDGNSVDALFKDNNDENQFRITVYDDSYTVYFNDTNITSDKELYAALDISNLKLLVKELKTYMQTYIKSSKLTSLNVDQEDAISSNKIYDCLLVIAGIYAEIIKECLSRAYTKNEIAIKIQQSDDTRTEKYITKDELKKQLLDIGEKGLELTKVLHVNDTD
ncbi:hypothetical protein D5R95_03295 [Methanosalsum natronophilum]|uniref:Chromosome segregation ATPase n=1 Tax=Methanosalsum natronophilum TaxID=768733 RepID=A0A424Z138_9EURY|nr:MAG: hypothetical protein D5R95_03295 [Methanosalsum natronophilum]